MGERPAAAAPARRCPPPPGGGDPRPPPPDSGGSAPSPRAPRPPSAAAGAGAFAPWRRDSSVRSGLLPSQPCNSNGTVRERDPSALRPRSAPAAGTRSWPPGRWTAVGVGGPGSVARLVWRVPAFVDRASVPQLCRYFLGRGAVEGTCRGLGVEAGGRSITAINVTPGPRGLCRRSWSRRAAGVCGDARSPLSQPLCPLVRV